MSQITITAEELAKHIVPGDLWIAVSGKVYDVSNFLSTHPGTEKPLLHFAGKDGTAGFMTKHPHVDISTFDAVKFVGDFVN